MSAAQPYEQRTLSCGCIVTRERGQGLWAVAEQTKPCALHLPGEWLGTLTVPVRS